MNNSLYLPLVFQIQSTIPGPPGAVGPPGDDVSYYNFIANSISMQKIINYHALAGNGTDKVSQISFCTKIVQI